MNRETFEEIKKEIEEYGLSRVIYSDNRESWLNETLISIFFNLTTDRLSEEDYEALTKEFIFSCECEIDDEE